MLTIYRGLVIMEFFNSVITIIYYDLTHYDKSAN